MFHKMNCRVYDVVSFVWTVGLLDRALGVGGLDSLRHLPWLGRALGIDGVDSL